MRPAVSPCALPLLCVLRVDVSDTCKLGINEDATAVLAHDDLLVHLDLHLALCRYAIEATATCVSLYIHKTKAVAGVAADTLKCLKQTLVVKLRLELLSLLAQFFLILLGLGDNLVEFTLLLTK